MKEIQLSKQGKNKGRFVVLVDDEDFEELNKFRWCALKDDHAYYAVRSCHIDGKYLFLYIHTVIMNTPKGMEVDHIDRNGLNCQKYNLRNCFHNQNGCNRKAWGSSKYLGVSVDRMGNRTRAQIMINRKTLHLGNFKTEEGAARAYDKKAKEFFGEFANLNFKDEAN